MNRKACMAELNDKGCFIAHEPYTPNAYFYLCEKPAVGAIDFFGTTIWLCAEHFDVFAPSYEEVFQ
jgi:hypothetical protein